MILLDTNVLLWFLAGDKRLSVPVQQAIQQDSANYFVSTASLWEVAIKRQIGKLTLEFDLMEAITDSGFILLDILATHITTYETLPLYHRDPFDRMLVAQAKTEGVAIVSADSMFKDYDIKLIST